MPGEYPGEIGRTYLNEVSSFLDGNFGFKLIETVYDGPGTACFVINGETIRFDAFFIQTILMDDNPSTNTNRLQYVCECKLRTDGSALLREFKTFLIKAKKVIPILKGRYTINFRFLFITNTHFGIDENRLDQLSFWKELCPEMEAEDFSDFMSYIKIIILPSWFLKMLYRGTRI